jgi:CRP/FNR family transcriptional regulator, cyclic AMP receptor protein
MRTIGDRGLWSRARIPGRRVAIVAAQLQVPLLAELSDQDLGRLVPRLWRRRYARREVIFRAGDPGTNLYIVESGRVKLFLQSPEGRELIIDLIGPGDFFGTLAVLDGQPHGADAVAIEPSQVLVLEREAFLGLLDECPRLAMGLLAVLCRRLRRDTRLLRETSFLDVPARLAWALLRLAGSDGRAAQDGTVITLCLTQTDLAGIVGTTRETLNKWLRTYERQGLIRCDKGHIVVRQPQGLRKRFLYWSESLDR